MGWIIGFAVYAVLALGVLILVGGVRRGDLWHDKAILDLAAFDPHARSEPPRLRSAGGKRAVRRRQSPARAS